MPEVRYCQDPDAKFKEGTAFIGFPGPGMVGPMAIDLLAQLLDLKEIGRVRIPGVEPMIYFEEGVMRHPTLILGAPDHNMAVVLLGVEVPSDMRFTVADFFVDWAKSNNIRNLATLVSQLNEEPESTTKPAHVEFVAERENLTRLLESETTPIPSGSVRGFHAAVLDASLLEKAVDASVFIVRVADEKPDASLAVELVEKLVNAFDLHLPEDWKNRVDKYVETLSAIFGDEANPSEDNQK